jgi:addiction module RelB/DinJ family antitoxin
MEGIKMASDRISFRIDSDIKKQAEIISSELGTNTSSVLSVMLHAFVRKRGIPFDVSLTLETYEDRIALNKALDEAQEIIDRGDKKDFIAHEDVREVLRLRREKI